MRNQTVRCIACKIEKNLEDALEKNAGFMCQVCAHFYELELHDAGHDPVTCPICMPYKKAS